MPKDNHEVIENELKALTILDNGAAMAAGTRADHVMAQNATVVLQKALQELETFREAQNDQSETSGD